MKINIKSIARIAEHITLIMALGLAVGFYFGNQYGNAHVDVKALKTAAVAPQTQPVAATVEPTSK